ncbi:hypothetical protein D5265_006955 [Enterobacter mori]|nr:hypothetical protein D5265_006955 [Enterobacter mori]
MSFNFFDKPRQFSSILSLKKNRDTYHIDGTSSLYQNNLREINYENHQICCSCCCPVCSVFRRFCCRASVFYSGTEHE